MNVMDPSCCTGSTHRLNCGPSGMERGERQDAGDEPFPEYGNGNVRAQGDDTWKERAASH